MMQTYRSCGRVVASAALLFSSTVPIWAAFTDKSADIGIVYQHSVKTETPTNHAGAAVVDVNADGLPDFLFAREGMSPLLYVNGGDGNFAEETEARGLSSAVDAAGFGAADFDNDGDQDIFMSVHEGSRFYLYINDGSGNFAEDAVARGADVTTSELDHHGYSVSVIDYNLDGFLDIYVSEWGIELSESGEAALHSVLLRNVGAASPGLFVNATVEAGLVQPVKGERQDGFSAAWADFDGDGWPDLALVADSKKSQMYWNDGDGSFTQRTSASGVGFDENGVGVAVADYDGDGLLDFYVTSIFDQYSLNQDGTKTGNKLYRNNGNRNFQEVSVSVGPSGGVSRGGWGQGAAFFEADNDGDFDIVVTNGSSISEGGDPETTPFVDAATDVTTLFENQGNGTFRNETAMFGLTDNRYGKAVLVADWDADGDEDLVIVNSHSAPVFYESDASDSGNRWLRITLEGTVSNKDAIGTRVRVKSGSKTQTLYYNPTNAYIGQREGVLHFGLGAAGDAVDEIEIRWPSGSTQVFSEGDELATNEVHHFVEPEDLPIPPLFTSQPQVEEMYGFGDELELTVAATGTPEPVYVWLKNGKTIDGASGPRFRIKRLAPFDQGSYSVKAINAGGETESNAVAVNLQINVAEHSVARWWNEFLMEAIRRDFPDPTKHSRNLYHLSAAMWDAFWAYEEEGWSRAKPVFHEEVVSQSDWGGDRVKAQQEAISHAAYRILTQRYKNSPGSDRSEFGFNWLMDELGFDGSVTTTIGMSPAAVGNRIGQAVLELNYEDGSNEIGNFADTSGYEAVNEPLVLELSGTDMADINRWQPLAFDFAVSQNGIPIGALVQSFLGVNWREVETFAMRKTSQNTIAFDPGPPPLMGTETQDAFIESATELIYYSSLLDPSDGKTIDISPGAQLNNPLGTNDGTGRSVNPATGEPYAANVVNHADYGRILAEFWADGPASETPPGHWNTLHNEISDHPLFTRRYMGKGEVLPALEWDVRAYLALNGGMHDAAIAAWTLKRQYDYSRPISMIRALCGRGQSSDPDVVSYNPDGIKLVPGLVELITEESAGVGERHEHLSTHIGQIAIRAWSGEPEDPHTGVGGVDWMLGEDWFPYQRGTFVSPAFAAYVSGHSTFSRTGAEVMTLLTGSPFFPGGLGEFVFPKGAFLEFEYGPSEDVTLQWATYYDAADQAGLSRLYGGIHVRADDFIGRTLGARVGVESFLRAHEQRNAVAGTGILEEIRIERGLGSDREGVLIGFESEGADLPMTRVDSLEGSEYRESPGIYFVVPRPGAVANDLVSIAGVGRLRKASFDGSLDAGDRLSAEFEVKAEEPVIVLAWARGASLGEGVTDVAISVSREGENGVWSEIAANDDWHERDTSSIAEALILRNHESLALVESDAALELVLESGTYRLEVSAVAGSGSVRLEIGGEGWRAPE